MLILADSRFPPVLQAASLKRGGRRPVVHLGSEFSACFAGGLIEADRRSAPQNSRLTFSACFAGGLIEAGPPPTPTPRPRRFSACFAGGLIEADRCRRRASSRCGRFPPVLQAASLKRRREVVGHVRRRRFPPVLQAASLKRQISARDFLEHVVFRLFCRRPH